MTPEAAERLRLARIKGAEKSRIAVAKAREDEPQLPLVVSPTAEQIRVARRLLANGDTLEHVAELVRMEPSKLRRWCNHYRC